MLAFQNIFTDDPKQQAEILLPDNTNFILKLQYNSTTSGWYADVIYPNANFSVFGIKITNNLNILHPFKNKLGFGLAFITSDNGEIWYKDDFSSGRTPIYLLDRSDIDSVGNIYNNI